MWSRNGENYWAETNRVHLRKTRCLVAQSFQQRAGRQFLRLCLAAIPRGIPEFNWVPPNEVDSGICASFR